MTLVVVYGPLLSSWLFSIITVTAAASSSSSEPRELTTGPDSVYPLPPSPLLTSIGYQVQALVNLADGNMTLSDSSHFTVLEGRRRRGRDRHERGLHQQQQQQQQQQVGRGGGRYLGVMDANSVIDSCGQLVSTGLCSGNTPLTLVSFSVPVDIYSSLGPQIQSYFEKFNDDTITVCGYQGNSLGTNGCKSMNQCLRKVTNDASFTSKLCNSAFQLCKKSLKYLSLINPSLYGNNSPEAVINSTCWGVAPSPCQVVDPPSSDWIWTQPAGGTSPSCLSPPISNVAKVCQGGESKGGGPHKWVCR